MTEKDIIYTNYETSILLGMIRKAVVNVEPHSLYNCMDNLRSVLGYIANNYKTLSEGYFTTIIKKHECNLGENTDKIIDILFHKDKYKLPLLINDPLVGPIAIFRLKLGK
jgi:hypothetical protein